MEYIATMTTVQPIGYRGSGNLAVLAEYPRARMMMMERAEIGILRICAVAISLRGLVSLVSKEPKVSIPEPHIGDDTRAVEIYTVLSTSHESPTECEQPQTDVFECPNDFPTSEVLFVGARRVLR